LGVGGLDEVRRAPATHNLTPMSLAMRWGLGILAVLLIGVLTIIDVRGGNWATIGIRIAILLAGVPLFVWGSRNRRRN
jgi:hypothetical protein